MLVENNKYISELVKGDRQLNIEHYGINWVSEVENGCIRDKSYIRWEYDRSNQMNGGGYKVLTDNKKGKEEYKPLFTTKHYKAIEIMLLASKPVKNESKNKDHSSKKEEQWRGTVGEFAIFLSKDNPKFKWQKFIDKIIKS